ncbi:MAG: Cof-type HAD-IIB family hydrolase [Erysipelotrichaceae bacterium]|nr:Cof-type HAD-IIB family hydrolase [Erysipelotrichaceae bacterium]
MIILTDVDGTIYDYEGRLPQSAVTAIRRLRANGHKVYMVTGRSRAENKKELWDIGFDGMIGGNGSYVEADGEVLMHQRITYEQCKHIVDWLKERDLDFFEESNNGLFASQNFVKNAKEPIRRYMTGKGVSEEQLKNIDVKDVINGLVEGAELYRDDLNKVSFILHSYKDHLDSVGEFPDLKAGTWGGVGDLALFGDLGVKDIDKGKAIEVLLKHIGAGVEETVGIGDSKTDIPMLQFCKIGIALGSASEETKRAADYITDDVDKDGFYKAFEHFGLI